MGHSDAGKFVFFDLDRGLFALFIINIRKQIIIKDQNANILFI
ncbi:MAG: hypothetical protein RCH30_3160 [Candidatus Phytoplasma australasiaticum]|nr:hypothetical protein [Sweet potato little leaf phytoplasma]QLL36875.1 hypothetical protein EPWB_v2c2720 ['Echinacea purpurea' witches'-broom phytoplasma]WKV64123.1 MAG: hypothetical protein NCHU2022_c2730 [Candidatus Phytoplasma australasiaticum]WMW50202.1 MAG: hypothetical protein RCH30_3160 [Candidatus Phytoplasma australasiaticum]